MSHSAAGGVAANRRSQGITHLSTACKKDARRTDPAVATYWNQTTSPTQWTSSRGAGGGGGRVAVRKEGK